MQNISSQTCVPDSTSSANMSCILLFLIGTVGLLENLWIWVACFLPEFFNYYMLLYIWHFSFTKDKVPKMKSGSCCRVSTMQFSSPSSRSFANFNIELEQFCCLLSAAKACIWNIGPNRKSSVFKIKFKASQLTYGPQSVSCL